MAMTTFPKVRLSVWMFFTSCAVAGAQTNGVVSNAKSTVVANVAAPVSSSTNSAPNKELAQPGGRLFEAPKAQWLILDGLSPRPPALSASSLNEKPKHLALEKPEQDPQLPTLLHDTSSSPNNLSVGRETGDDYFHRGQYARIMEEGLLKSPQPVYGSELERRIVDSFRPEIIHVGHAQISCSLITAIARKNPLCLLSRSFIGISF